MYPLVTYLVETLYISAKMLYMIVLNYIYAFAEYISFFFFLG